MPEFETTKLALCSLLQTKQPAEQVDRQTGWMARASGEMVNGPSAGN
jgi:hypothetical protein